MFRVFIPAEELRYGFRMEDRELGSRMEVNLLPSSLHGEGALPKGTLQEKCPSIALKKCVENVLIAFSQPLCQPLLLKVLNFLSHFLNVIGNCDVNI